MSKNTDDIIIYDEYTKDITDDEDGFREFSEKNLIGHTIHRVYASGTICRIYLDDGDQMVQIVLGDGGKMEFLRKEAPSLEHMPTGGKAN